MSVAGALNKTEMAVPIAAAEVRRTSQDYPAVTIGNQQTAR